MNFRKDIEPSCAYCEHGSRVSVDKVACVKRGVVNIYGACSKFVYAPLKRHPDRPRKLISSDHGDQTFTL